jgi:hypothetical protein
MATLDKITKTLKGSFLIYVKNIQSSDLKGKKSNKTIIYKCTPTVDEN